MTAVRKLVVDPEGSVVNVIIADDDFALAGFTLVPNDGGGLGWTYLGGVLTPPADAPVDPPSLDDAKAAQLRVINATAQQEVQSYMESYPDFETLTWATQATESAAWLAAAAPDRTATLVPWCANAAENRLDSDGNPMALDVFMGKVAEKAQAFMEVSSNVAGKRQGYEDAITAATAVEQVLAVVWVD